MTAVQGALNAQPCNQTLSSCLYVSFRSSGSIFWGIFKYEVEGIQHSLKYNVKITWWPFSSRRIALHKGGRAWVWGWISVSGVVRRNRKVRPDPVRKNENFGCFLFTGFFSSYRFDHYLSLLYLPYVYRVSIHSYSVFVPLSFVSTFLPAQLLWRQKEVRKGLVVDGRGEVYVTILSMTPER